VKEEALARWGLLRQKENKLSKRQADEALKFPKKKCDSGC
jgi:hypothetical protein